MSRRAPAIDIRWPRPPDEDEAARVLAVLDDYGPSAVDELSDGLRVFFAAASNRDAALTDLARSPLSLAVQPIDVPDEQWAERSQADLMPVRVGRLVVAPPSKNTSEVFLKIPPRYFADVLILIQPSMGFGTGHHASTRLCLALLQHVPMSDASLLDVGTGSGVLALAGWRLGASRVLGLDVDPDALQSARENLNLNGASDAIELRLEDALAAPLPATTTFDVVTANLTGAMLERHAGTLGRLLAPGGHLIASGFQQEDAAAVNAALEVAGLTVTSRLTEDGWIGVLAANR